MAVSPASAGRPLRKRLASRITRAHRAPPGSAPDALLPPAEATATSARVLQYDANTCSESTPGNAATVAAVKAHKQTHWVDVQGLADAGFIGELGEAAGLHPLAIADLVHTRQRPKVDIFDDHVIVVLRMPQAGGNSRSEQVTLVVREHCVISFQEAAGDCFDPVRERLRSGLGRIRTAGADYLAYALLDAVIDSYFPVLEAFGDRAEHVEERVLSSTVEAGEIHLLKRELLELRHAIWPLRELLASLLRDDTPVFRKATRLYLRDCADHAFQLMDIIEIYREISSGLVDLHLSSVSNRMNETMKVLTIIATIFIPMTFIAGVYGMNFDRASGLNMPELGWRYGYLFALGLMAVSAAGIVWLFRRNGWIGKRRQ